MSAPNENDLPYIQAVQMAGLINKTREKQPLTAEEQQQLKAWLNSSGSHEALLASLLDRKQVAGELEVLMQYDEDNAVSAVFRAIGNRPPSVTRRSTRMVRRFSVAALVLLLAGAGWWFVNRRQITEKDGRPSLEAVAMLPGNNKALLTMANGRKVMLDSTQNPDLGMQGAARVEQQAGRLVYTARGNGPVVYNTITTPRGGQYSVKLADGSEVWLNAASSIIYPTTFAGDKRDVTITGEAWFSVAKDRAKPFFVTANKMKVQVVGTEFNIMAYNDEDAIRTTLVNGVVKVGNIAGGQELTLQPGEQATFVHRSGEMRIEKAVIDDVTAWRYGQFRFHETNIPAIMRQITRWYDVKVEYRGAVDNIYISGQIARKERVQELLDILSDTRKVHFEIKDDKTIVVIPGPK